MPIIYHLLNQTNLTQFILVAGLWSLAPIFISVLLTIKLLKVTN